MTSAREISNLLFRYAELMDGGRLEEVASLFHWAKVKTLTDQDLLDEQGLLRLWRKHVQIYPCGTPRTKHVITNPIIEVDDVGDVAIAHSYYSVYQATDDFPLQLIAAGRYHDEFERVDGRWRFRYRDYSMMDLTGDLSRHLKNWG